MGRETHGCEKHPSVASLHAPRPGREPETRVYICPGPGVEPDTFLFYRMTLQRTEPWPIGAYWLQGGSGGPSLVESVIARCGHRPATRPALQEGHLPRQPIGGSHSPSPEPPLLLPGSWIVLLCLRCSWHSPGTHLLDCFTQQPFSSYSQILVTCYHDPAICVFQKVWNLHSKGCL